MGGAFLHKKSLLDQFKDDYKMVDPIKARRTERQWENPIVRHKREKGVQDWAKSFAGKRHYRKLTRFNAMRSEAYTEKTAWTYLEELGKLEGEESRMDAAEKILKALGCKPGTEGRWYGKDGDEIDIIDVLDNTEWAFAQKVCGQLQEARQAKKIYPKFVQINTQRDFDKYIKPALGKGADAYGLSDIEGMWWEIADGERVPASAKTMREIRDSISKRPRFIFISGAGAERGITDMSLTEYAEEMGMTVKEYLNGYDAGNWESKQNERSSEDYLQEIYDSLESAWDKSKFNLSKGYDSYYDCQCVRVSLKENPNFYSLTYVIEPGDANYVADRPASFQTVWRYPNDRGVGVGEELEFQSTDFDEFGKSVFDYFDEIQKLSARKTSFESKKSETLSYEKGNKNSRGEDAPWVIRDHKGGKVLASFAKKADAEEPEYRADDLGALAHHEAFHLCEEHMSYNIKDLRDKLCTYLKNEVEKVDLAYDVKALEDSPYPSLAITSKPDDGHYYLEGYLVELKPSDVRFKYQYYGHPHEEVVIVGDDAQDLDVIAKYLFAQVEPKVAEDFSLSNQEIVDAIKKADAATQSDERPFVIDIDDKGSRVDVWLKSKETGKDIWNPSWGVVTGVKKIATYDTDENGSADVVGDDPYGSAEDITAFFTKAFSDKAGAKGEEAEEPEYRADDLYDFSSIRHESLKKTLHESRVKKLEAFGRSYRENVILQILDQGNNTYSKEDLEGKTVAELEEIYSELINLADAAKHEAAEDITSRDVQAAARSAWSASGAKDFKLDTEKLDDVVRIRAMGPKGEDNIGIWWVVSLPSLSVDQYAEWGAKPYEQEPERTYDAKDLDDLEDFFLDEFKALQETLDVSKEN